MSLFLVAAWCAGAAPGADGETLLTLDTAQTVFKNATQIGPAEGSPAASEVYDDSGLIGYLASTRSVLASTGFSGKPLDVLVGIGIDGTIVDAKIVEHHEPILIIGVADADLDAFVDQYRGIDIRQPVRLQSHDDPSSLDIVSGATVSSLVINDAILRTARNVAASRGLLGAAAGRVDLSTFEPKGWSDLVADGSLVRLGVTVGQAMAALDAKGAGLYPEGVDPPEPAAPWFDLYVGLATPARIGRNLLGDKAYNRALSGLSVGDHLIFVAGSGAGSFKGTSFRQTGSFDRLQVVQGDRTITFTRDDYIPVAEIVADGAPEMRDSALFVVRDGNRFDPGQDWRLDILIPAAGDSNVQALFSTTYALPARYVTQSEAIDQPLWLEAWQARPVKIAILIAALAVLTAILVFQDTLAARPVLYQRVRIAFLVFTLIWIGWYAGAQLSVLNVLTFAEAVRTDFRWELFLLEPLIFVLWGYVAVTLLFWGRGVFCGWLCPFGALQELVNRVAVAMKVPQLNIPFGLNERLWPIKYVLFIGLFGLSLSTLPFFQGAMEVEPFKTAIVLHFDRAWPFVLYAAILLVAGIFVQRAFCRYLCPLGAALAIPARLRMFEWLKRRWQCGAQCQRCAAKCPVQAIHPDGKINPNECIHCLHCQVQYFDDHVCPPLIERRKRRERIAAAGKPAALAGEAKP